MIQSFFHRKISGSLYCALVIAVIISAIQARFLYWDARSFSLQISMSSSVNDEAVLYLDTGGGFSERETERNNVEGDNEFHTYNFSLPPKTIYNLRFDPLTTSGIVKINSIAVVNGFGNSLLSIDLNALRPAYHIQAFDLKSNTLKVVIEDRANDPQILIVLGSSLKFDSFENSATLPFIVHLLGGFLIFFFSSLFLIWILRRRGILIGFFDHPVKKAET